MNHPVGIAGSLLLVLAGAAHAVDATAQAVIQNGYVFRQLPVLQGQASARRELRRAHRPARGPV